MATFQSPFQQQLQDAVRRKDRNLIRQIRYGPGVTKEQQDAADQALAEVDAESIGGNTFGGNTFGGNTFGGLKFGGQKFGASAPPHTPPANPGQPGMSTPPAPAGPDWTDYAVQALEPYLDPYNLTGGFRGGPNGGLDWAQPGFSKMMTDAYQNYIGQPFAGFVADTARNFGYDMGPGDVPPAAGMTPEDQAAAAMLAQYGQDMFGAPGIEGSMGMGGPAQTGMEYSYAPLDYVSGYPQQPPQMPPADYTAADAAFAEAAPMAPEMDPNNQILAWLGNAAAAAGQSQGGWGQVLAAAGGAGMLGLQDQRQREQTLNLAYEAQKRQYALTKAQIANARASDQQQLEYENAKTSYEHGIQLHQLQLQNDAQMQPDVQLTAGGMVMRKFNPATGQIEVSITRDNEIQQYLQKRMIDRALGLGSGSTGISVLDLTPDKIDLSDLPPESRPYAQAATYLMDGFADPTAFGVDLTAVQEQAQQEALEAGLTGEEASRVTRLNTFKYLMGILSYAPQTVAGILSYPIGGQVPSGPELPQ